MKININNPNERTIAAKFCQNGVIYKRKGNDKDYYIRVVACPLVDSAVRLNNSGNYYHFVSFDNKSTYLQGCVIEEYVEMILVGELTISTISDS
jgi:hypothetical protein